MDAEKTRWFDIVNIHEVDSPSIAIYENRVDDNIVDMIELVGGATHRLLPHIKTVKMPALIVRMMQHGIASFKTATISEAEAAATCGAENVFLSHQLVGPKVERFFELIQSFPKTTFITVIDNRDTAQLLNEHAESAGVSVGIYIDINNGMDRSGVRPGKKLQEVLEELGEFGSLSLKGLHVYDGHIRDQDVEKRKFKVDEGMELVEKLYRNLKSIFPELQLVCGGTPSFSTHCQYPHRICSPGTCVLWDWGYREKLTELDFQYAALVISRVISKPTRGIVTIDMGHKSVAAENPINTRVKFLNLDGYEFLFQSEEHGVLKVKDWDKIEMGQVLYGVPYHICPTVNLHDTAYVIRDNMKVDDWAITARRRKIKI